MAITAKVYCNNKTVTRYPGGNTLVGFTVDYSDGRNTGWAAATPSLDLKMSVKDAELFTLGAAYTLTLEPDVEPTEG